MPLPLLTQLCRVLCRLPLPFSYELPLRHQSRCAAARAWPLRNSWAQLKTSDPCPDAPLRRGNRIFDTSLQMTSMWSRASSHEW